MLLLLRRAGQILTMTGALLFIALTLFSIIGFTIGLVFHPRPADADPGVDFAFGIDLTGLEALVGLIMFFIGGAFWASRMYDWQGDRKPRLQ